LTTPAQGAIIQTERKKKGDTKMTYFIYINGKAFEVCGCEAAYEAFRKACDFGGMIGALVTLVDGETGEVLADNEEDE